MTTLMRVIVRLCALGALAVLGACSQDHRITDPPRPPKTDSAMVSEPVRSTTVNSAVLQTKVAAATLVGEGDVVYVSLRPGTLPNGAVATVRNQRTGNSAIVRLVDGGLDPLPMAAHAGDTLDLAVTDQLGATTYSAYLAVPFSKPPSVVRTIPAKGKTDSPLNTHVVVVFSEPVDGATITTASIRLLRGGTPVAGTVHFLDPSLDATHVSVEFVPNAALAPRLSRS